MTNSIIFALGLGLIFGVLFFIVDIYNEQKTREINTSLIAGITITYFFIILLPDIETGLEGFAFPLFKFIGVLTGFCAIHLTEKYILLRVERESQIKLKEIYKEEEENLEKEKNLEKSLINKIIGNDLETSSIIKIAEKLFALREITKIQNLSIEEGKNIEKNMNGSNNKLPMLNQISALMEISLIHSFTLEEERKFQNSLFKILLQNEQDKPFIRDIMLKLNILRELCKKEEEFLESEQNLETFLIKDLINDNQNLDKLAKKEFTFKLGELKNISKLRENCVEREDNLEKAMLNKMREDYIGEIYDLELVEQICALKEISKLQEVCLVEEKKLENNILNGDINKLSILSRLSALKEISKIRVLYIEEEERLEKLFKNMLKAGDHSTLPKKELINDIDSIEEIRKIKKESMIKGMNLEKYLIDGLMEDNQNTLSLSELTQKLNDMAHSSTIQGELNQEERKVATLMIDKTKEKGNYRLTLNEIAVKLNTFCQQEEELEIQGYIFKDKIQNHINERLDDLHQYTNFIYHLIIGIILFELLLQDFVFAGLFFIFAFFKALTSKSSNDITLFPDIPVNEESSTPLYLKIIFASAALIGVFLGLLTNDIFYVSMEIIFFLFSFISGVILYTIIREVLPENESGQPFYFILGIIIFLVIIVTLESLSLIISI